MLAELAAANAAFAIIKKTIANGQDLTRVAKQATSYFDSKSQIAKKAKKNGSKSDMEAFMAMETLKKQEEELKELMIYAGRANLYDDWLQFQADCKRKRKEEEKQRLHKAAKTRQMVLNVFTGLIVAIVTIPVVIALVYSIVGFLK
jgi:molecular chaperone GrpE (heat shock protein)